MQESAHSTYEFSSITRFAGDKPPHGRPMQLGRWGEARARQHFESLGCKTLARNWSPPRRLGIAAELDLVCVDPGAALLVCEVKTRSSGSMGSVWEAMTPLKLARTRAAAIAWRCEFGTALPLVLLAVALTVEPRQWHLEVREVVR